MKSVSYRHTNTYDTFGTFGKATKNVWIAFHGMGYLSKYFIRYFQGLDPEKNYVIIPQAPSKYYQDSKFKYVGASWLTKENTAVEKENVLRYIDAVWEAEALLWKERPIRLILMGYSQGVSIVTRWASSRKINCDHLVLHSGAIPDELRPADFDHLDEKTIVTYLYGDKDQYITEARKTEQQLKGSALFGNRLRISVFDGIHEVHVKFIEQLAKEK